MSSGFQALAVQKWTNYTQVEPAIAEKGGKQMRSLDPRPLKY